ncbi:MAG: sulfatase [Planctomycetota bacterium]
MKPKIPQVLMNQTLRQRRRSSSASRGLALRALAASIGLLLAGCGLFEDDSPPEVRTVRVDQTWSLVAEMGGRDGRFGSYVPLSLVSVYEDQREAILIEPRFHVSFRQVPLFEDARLAVDIAVPSKNWEKMTSPVTFRIELEDQSGTRELYRRELDPKNVPGDRGWIPVEVPLPGGSASGQPLVTVTFAADGEDRSQGRLTAWSRGRIESRGRQIEVGGDPLVSTEPVKDLLQDELLAHRSEKGGKTREGVVPFGLKLPFEPGEIPALRIDVGARLDFENVALPERPLIDLELFAIGVKLDPQGLLRYRITMTAGGRETLVAQRELDAAELERWEFGFRTLREKLPLPVLAESATLSVEVTGGATNERLLTGVSRFRVLEETRAERRVPGDKPNVLVLLVDTLRADHLGAYGYDRDTSPNFDRLAERGILFRNAVAQSSWTLPSTVSLLTGLYPQTHGSLEGATIRLRDDVPTLPGLLLEKRIATGGFAANFIISEKNGFARGFQKLDELFLQPAAALNASLLDWIDRQGGRPFFGYVHYFDPHTPYAPPAPFDRQFATGSPDIERERSVAIRWARLEEENPFYLLFDWKVVPEVEGDFKVTPERELILSEWLVQHWIDRYDGEIRYWDAELGRLLDDLEQRQVLDDTWILITSDHGEAFGEHAFFGHGDNLHDELIRVPYLIVPPGDRKGQIVERPVELVDILPTVLSIYGFPQPQVPLVPSGLPGRILAPGDRNDRGAGFAFVRGRAIESDDVVTLERAALRSAERKVMTELDSDSWRFYDLTKDPGEQNALNASELSDASPLRSALDQWTRETPSSRREVTTLDEATRQKMIQLGYINSVSPAKKRGKDRPEKDENPEDGGEPKKDASGN